jgi:hypothetical protein
MLAFAATFRERSIISSLLFDLRPALGLDPPLDMRFDFLCLFKKDAANQKGTCKNNTSIHSQKQESPE